MRPRDYESEIGPTNFVFQLRCIQQDLSDDERTLNVLYLQHIFSVRVNTDSPLATQQRRATTLAMLIIDELGDAEQMRE